MSTVTRLAVLTALASAVWLPFPAAAATPADAKPVYSDAAALGKLMFFDASLSASGKMSCASCHSPSHAYGPPNGLAAQLGGPDMRSQGTRAVPSLRYV
ncbi:cytochrome-c peroxidase, partial [Paraburkholderia sediminicola]